jgi:hypothetical protein
MGHTLTTTENRKEQRDEPLKDPDKAFGSLDEAKYKAELQLVDRYQSFVAELLRLSLLGIAVFGFLYKIALENNANIDAAKYPAALGVLLFGISAASALIFRFFAIEGARYYIEALRFTPTSIDSTQPLRTEERDHQAEKQKLRAEESLQIRYHKVVICRWSKAISAITLGLGGVLEAVAYCVSLFGET